MINTIGVQYAAGSTYISEKYEIIPCLLVLFFLNDWVVSLFSANELQGFFCIFRLSFFYDRSKLYYLVQEI